MPQQVTIGQPPGSAGADNRDSVAVPVLAVGIDDTLLTGMADAGVTLFFYVVPGGNQEQPTASSVNLGKLVENTGNRVVPIPAEVDLSGYLR